jgi:hypothetical protein
VIGAISGAYLAPTISWRGLFLVGLAPAVVVSMIRYWVPEIATLSDAHGAPRGGAPLARLGLAVWSRRDRDANDAG